MRWTRTGHHVPRRTGSGRAFCQTMATLLRAVWYVRVWLARIGMARACGPNLVLSGTLAFMSAFCMSQLSVSLNGAPALSWCSFSDCAISNTLHLFCHQEQPDRGCATLDDFLIAHEAKLRLASTFSREKEAVPAVRYISQ